MATEVKQAVQDTKTHILAICQYKKHWLGWFSVLDKIVFDTKLHYLHIREAPDTSSWTVVQNYSDTLIVDSLGIVYQSSYTLSKSASKNDYIHVVMHRTRNDRHIYGVRISNSEASKISVLEITQKSEVAFNVSFDSTVLDIDDVMFVTDKLLRY